MFDTPGLADATGSDEEYLRKIKEKVTHLDLFLFCTEMTSKRFRTDDLETMKKLTEALGEKLWEHALVVLTFANEVPLSPTKKTGDVPEVTVFNNRFLCFKKAINKHLVTIGVPEITVTNVPFTPAGELDDPRLPDREDWLTAFWIAAFKRINRNAKAAFLMANVDRISLFSTSGEGNEESKVRKDGNVCQSLTIEERNAIKESGGKLKESGFDKKLSRCFDKIEMKTKEECPTSPGQGAKVSGPSINANETFSEEIFKEIVSDVSGQFIVELTSTKKTKTSDEPDEECPTSPGQVAKVSVPFISKNETYSKDIKKEMLADVTGQFIGELTSAKKKTETSDEPEDECPTSPGQDAKVSGPYINRNETCSKDVEKEILADVTGQFIGELTSAKKKTETSDEPEDECPTSPGQVAKVSGPIINRNETCSKDVKKEMLANATGNILGELTTAKFGGKYGIFLRFLLKYLKKRFPLFVSKPRLEGMKK